MLSCCACLCLGDTLRVELEQAAPASRRVDRGAHRFAAGAVALEVAVLEIDARGTVAGRREADLDLARLREVGLVAPLVRDHPGQHEAMRRLPDQDLSPRAVGAVFLLAVAAAAH